MKQHPSSSCENTVQVLKLKKISWHGCNLQIYGRSCCSVPYPMFHKDLTCVRVCVCFLNMHSEFFDFPHHRWTYMYEKKKDCCISMYILKELINWPNFCMIPPFKTPKVCHPSKSGTKKEKKINYRIQPIIVVFYLFFSYIRFFKTLGIASISSTGAVRHNCNLTRGLEQAKGSRNENLAGNKKVVLIKSVHRNI